MTVFDLLAVVIGLVAGVLDGLLGIGGGMTIGSMAGVVLGPPRRTGSVG